MGCKASPLTTHDMSQFHVLKLVGVSDNYDAVAQAEAELDSLCCISISATRSSNYYIDVTHADKAAPSGNSKSVIVSNRPLLQDPMVVPDGDPAEPAAEAPKLKEAGKTKTSKLTSGLSSEAPVAEEPPEAPAGDDVEAVERSFRALGERGVGIVAHQRAA